MTQRLLCFTGTTATLIAAFVTLTNGTAQAQSANLNWKSETISPVANPIYFEDPFIHSEIRPIFIEHTFPKTFEFHNGKVPLGGDAQVYAVQLRYAVNDRLAIIATKDGYIDMKPDHVLDHTHGWGNLAAGLKYAIIDDPENEFILTPGLTLEIPTGNTDVQQGRGKGEWNLFASAAKGFGKFHVTGNVGFRIPNDFDAQTWAHLDCTTLRA